MSKILDAFAARRVCIVYRKADKCPVNPLDGSNSDAQNPATHMLPVEAAMWAAALGPGYGVGIVITAGSGLFCVDIDGAFKPDGTHTEIAQTLLDLFPGCYVERSQSGNGLHIFGTYAGPAPPHKTKDTQLHIELYTEKRFIGLTGTDERGDLIDATIGLWAVSQKYFQRTVLDGGQSKEWTTTDDPACTITGTDDERIHWLRTHPSNAAKLGGLAFGYLWEGNVKKIAERFPANDPGDLYDASSADQALANHLMYGFARNCDSVWRVMQRDDCKLRRDKWDRADYIESTLTNAAALPMEWRKAKPAKLAPVSPSVPIAIPPVETRSQQPAPLQHVSTASSVPLAPPPPVNMPSTDEIMAQFVGQSGMNDMFKGCVYVQDIHRIIMPNGNILDREQFDADPRFAKKKYPMDYANEKETDSAWEAFIQSSVSNGVKVRGITFDPQSPPGAIIKREGEDYVNTWHPVDIAAEPGDVTPFLDHLKLLLVDWRILLNYLKFMVQHKGIKAKWWPFVQGVQGNGKSFISDTMAYCIGKKYTQRPRADRLDTNFNGKLYACLFLGIDDIKIGSDHDKRWEIIKPMITQSDQEIEKKGIDSVTREVCFNAILNSNFKDGVKKTADDRRIAPMFSRQQHIADLERDGLTEKYFDNLWSWADPANGGKGWAYVAHYLATDPIDPDFSHTKCPVTSSTAEALRIGRSSAHQDVFDAVAQGRPGFKGGWYNCAAAYVLLAKYKVSRTQAEMIGAELGYIPHPALPDGRPVTPLSDNSRPVIYVQAGHTSLGVKDPEQVRAMYEAAQR